MSEQNGRSFLHRDPESGTTVPTLPFRIGDTAIHAPPRTPPTLGMNSREILSELGYSESRITELEKSDTVRTANQTN